MDVISNSFTFEAWIKTSSAGKDRVIIGKMKTPALACFRFGTGNVMGQGYIALGWSWGDRGRVRGETIINDDTWHHVVGVRDGTEIKIYVDGRIDGTDTVEEGGWNPTPMKWYIGSNEDMHIPFIGTIDEVRVSNTARNNSWITTTYNTMTDTITFFSTGSEESWMQWDNASQNPDTESPWQWNFNFPNGRGYYEFYSIGTKNDIVVESAPSSADAQCHYEDQSKINNTGSTDIKALKQQKYIHMLVTRN